MVQIEFDANVPESRQVVVTLPIEVPTGLRRLTITIDEIAAASDSLPSIVIPLRPDLMRCRSGQVVLTHEPSHP